MDHTLFMRSILVCSLKFCCSMLGTVELDLAKNQCHDELFNVGFANSSWRKRPEDHDQHARDGMQSESED